MSKYLDLSIIDINKKLKAKEIKPIDLINEVFERIGFNNLNAFITLNKEEAIKQALALENKEVDNLLFGIPIAIKDNIVTKNLKTTCASHMLDNFIPVYDATVVKKIKEKNMIIIGKTNMDEFAMGSTGETSYYKPAVNPWNNKKVPGGSSSGSAAAVCSRIVPLALGSDTGGSIRQPASFCGLVGLKPTYGRVSRYGLIAFASSLDQIGPMTRNVYENAALLNIISGEDDNDLTSSSNKVPDFTSYMHQDIKDLKVAIPNYYMSDQIDKDVRDNVTKIASMLTKQGVTIDYIDIDYLEYAIPLYQVIALGEASSNLARFDGIRYGHVTDSFTNTEELYQKSRAEGFGREVKRRIMIGSYILSGENADTYYDKALKVREALTNSFKQVFTKYDLIIGPTNTNVAYDLGIKSDDALKSFYDDLLTIPVNMAGLPAMSLPIGFNNEHLPIGLHIVGNYYDEGAIYKLASYIEKELDLSLNPGGDDLC
ncbi:MAG: Asp-tRNA(Asn)/Glu-tRNA(Gln) amidotransferase subunit GatA [Bacilli bacterium]|nr:Asp-tRNA(Asn)/Glu-tRNA(Gln) amidotransferase subunit GatA [Bacilli bacterium]